MAVRTAEVLRRQNQRLDRRLEQKSKVLGQMRGGACLHRFHAAGRVFWRLSTGDIQQISDETAAAVIADAHVIAVGDALAEWGPSQTYRWTNIV